MAKDRNQATEPKSWADELRESIVKRATPDSVRKASATGRVLPRTIVLRVGDEVTCVVIGPGPAMEITDRMTGEVKEVTSVHVKSGDIEFNLRSTYQLAQLNSLVGHLVTVICIEQRDIDEGRTLKEFVISDHGMARE